IRPLECERQRIMLARSPSPRLAVQWVIFCAVSTFTGPAEAQPAGRGPMTSRITIINADGTSPSVVLVTPRHFEAPNWSPDGTSLLLNSQGKLWRLPVAGGEP